MLNFEKNGKIVMTEKDNGELRLTEEAPKDWKAPEKATKIEDKKTGGNINEPEQGKAGDTGE